jgi:hypothetical protein
MAFKVEKEYKRGTPEQFREIVAKRFRIPVKNMVLKAIVEDGKFFGFRVYDGETYKGFFTWKGEK